MAELGANILAILNGQCYYDNEGGEVEADEEHYTVIICTTTPGADNADLFIENIADLNSAARDQHVFTAAQTVACH